MNIGDIVLSKNGYVYGVIAKNGADCVIECRYNPDSTPLNSAESNLKYLAHVNSTDRKTIANIAATCNYYNKIANDPRTIAHGPSITDDSIDQLALMYCFDSIDPEKAASIKKISQDALSFAKLAYATSCGTPNSIKDEDINKLIHGDTTNSAVKIAYGVDNPISNRLIQETATYPEYFDNIRSLKKSDRNKKYMIGGAVALAAILFFRRSKK